MKSNNFTPALILFFSIGLCLFNQSCDTSKAIQGSKDPSLAKEIIAGADEVEALYDGLNNGGILKLKKKTYYLDSPLTVTGQNNFILDGNGCTFIMKNKSEDVITIRNSNNVILKNFKATHIEPEGPIGCTGSVIQLDGNNNVLIEKCELNGSGIIGVVSYDNNNLRIIDNYIYNNSKYGVLFDGNTSLEIKGNKFEDNGANGNDHVAKALNDFLSEVESIAKGTNRERLKMSANTFK